MNQEDLRAALRDQKRLWREKNRPHYNKYMRDYMRDYNQKKREKRLKKGNNNDKAS